jgi:hypothetical protein
MGSKPVGLNLFSAFFKKVYIAAVSDQFRSQYQGGVAAVSFLPIKGVFTIK